MCCTENRKKTHHLGCSVVFSVGMSSTIEILACRSVQFFIFLVCRDVNYVYAWACITDEYCEYRDINENIWYHEEYSSYSVFPLGIFVYSMQADVRIARICSLYFICINECMECIILPKCIKSWFVAKAKTFHGKQTHRLLARIITFYSVLFVCR